MGHRREIELMMTRGVQGLRATKSPELMDRRYLPAGGVWVWGLVDHDLPGHCSLPYAVYKLLQGQIHTTRPRKSRASPLKCYATLDDAVRAFWDALQAHEAGSQK